MKYAKLKVFKNHIYLETPHHQGYNDIPLLLSHLGRHGQQHQHVVAFGDTHGVEIAQNISTSNFAYFSLDEKKLNTHEYVHLIIIFLKAPFWLSW